MRTVRLSQTISPFGVGAIFDVSGESLMGIDVSRWPFAKTRRIEARRLEQRLGVSELRSPPSVPSIPSKDTPSLPYQRFPRWLFCQQCRRMHFARRNDENARAPECSFCGGHLVPMRFIAVCRHHSHARDIPWDRWAHSEADTKPGAPCPSEALRFDIAKGHSEGLSSLRVRCVTCRESRDLGDLTTPGTLRRIGITCRGTQPWQHDHRPCDSPLEVVQRGATNVTIPDTTSALDIPEPDDPVSNVDEEIRAHRNFEDVRSGPAGPRAQVLVELIAEDVGADREAVWRAVANPTTDDVQLDEARTTLLNEEWRAFQQAVASPDEPTGTANFVVSAAELAPTADSPAHRALTERIAHVVLAHRLREVRVLHGFRRYDISADLVDVDMGPRGRARWLPAAESFGEGVFLALDADRLAAWESNAAVRDRAATLEKRRRDSLLGARLPDATPRLILLHTLAHLLIRRLAFTCGYSAASLRERIYAGTAMNEAGLLIYTAAGDSEGTLGGLVRQGEPPRLAQTILGALEEAEWCSADPVCRESRGQGLGSLNFAGCHGCCLVAETSCERSNILLDRAMVIGDDRSGMPGFLAPVVESLRESLALKT